MRPLVVRHLPQLEYEEAWRDMRSFCDTRTSDTADEIWMLQHSPVYTFGQAGRQEHLLRDNGIPVVRSDRGGQITYHGPGQIVSYLLIDLRRRRIGARFLVRAMQDALVLLLEEFGVSAEGDGNAPGVYVNGAKIAAVGLRIRHGCSYHGLSFNVDMDLSPFADINPCGYAGMPVTQLSDLVNTPTPPLPEIQNALARRLKEVLEESTDMAS